MQGSIYFSPWCSLGARASKGLNTIHFIVSLHPLYKQCISKYVRGEEGCFVCCDLTKEEGDVVTLSYLFIYIYYYCV